LRKFDLHVSHNDFYFKTDGACISARVETSLVPNNLCLALERR